MRWTQNPFFPRLIICIAKIVEFFQNSVHPMNHIFWRRCDCTLKIENSLKLFQKNINHWKKKLFKQKNVWHESSISRWNEPSWFCFACGKHLKHYFFNFFCTIENLKKKSFSTSWIFKLQITLRLFSEFLFSQFSF